LRKYWLFVAAVCGLLAGCPGFGDQLVADDRAVPPSWDVEIAPLMLKHCGACHGDPATNGAPLPLASWDQSVASLIRIGERAVRLQTMPPGGGLTDEERGLLAAWVLAGGPRTPADAAAVDGFLVDAAPTDGGASDATTGDAGPRPDGAMGPTWTADIGPLFAMRCAFDGCHGINGAQKSLVLANYGGFVAGGINGPVHGDGVPAQSRLIDALRGRNGLLLMPQGAPLEAEQLRLVEAFIAAGYPE
jgi:mono/diheme cytochrome c family protein